TLIKNHDLVVAEELRSKNMLRNHALAMSIADVGWRTLLDMLAYKADLYGRQFVTVDPRNTTQTCSDCGFVMADEQKLTLADRKWTCPQCGAFHIRDHNAAKNILAKGLALN
ncbi:RNA-guided endonuclease InsQ/TnpB family protein, partial [Lacticaseibacillus baoqingensis]